MVSVDLINRQTKQIKDDTMKANKIITQFIDKITPEMHATRQKSFHDCVVSIMNGHAVCVTQIGRGIQSKAIEKHRIKRADRLCSNANIFSERFSIYQSISGLLCHSNDYVIIHVDWSDLDNRLENYLLRASVMLDGRSITVYEEVHTVNTKEKRQTHNRFLEKLKCCLPSTVKPIIVTDAGFKCPWFQAVTRLGWDYVGRVRGIVTYQSSSDKYWRPVKGLYGQATSQPKGFLDVWLAKTNPTHTNLVLFKKKPKGRYLLTPSGRKATRKIDKSAAREREPWALVTSLTIKSTGAKRVVKIYQSRMQIEQTFRDMKSSRYGLGLDKNQTRKTKRLTILILLSTVASFLLTMIGLAAETLNLHRGFQANSIKNRRVISLHYLGKRIMTAGTVKLQWRQLKKTIVAVISQYSYHNLIG